jgi:hypothetical protein
MSIDVATSGDRNVTEKELKPILKRKNLTKFKRHGDLATGNCVPLLQNMSLRANKR